MSIGFAYVCFYKGITIFGSYDIQNNQGLSYQPQPTPTLTLIILDIIKTSSNNC